MTLDTNESSLVQISVSGQVSAPRMPPLPGMPHVIGRDGRPVIVPPGGGIVLNVKVGDPAFGWVAEQVNPGVSIRHPENEPNIALGMFSCLGNGARVMTGAARGATGVVTGKSGRWAEHVILHFGQDVLGELAIGDRIQVKGCGVGLQIPELPGIACKSMAPSLLSALDCSIVGGTLEVPVVAKVPPELLGAGMGLNSEGWSLDIQSGAPELLETHGLDKLRLGDVVALVDSDCSFGHGYRKGGMSIGVVCQGDSYRAGFGPGVTVIMTAPDGEITPVVRDGVNLRSLLGLG
jgi:hypothetical protein